MATKVATAYVQILPTTKNIKSNLISAMSTDVSSAGTTLGNSMGSTFKTALLAIAGTAVALGLKSIVSAAIEEGSALEQSLGGIETMFKENADTVIAYADQAWSTAGLSANEYMENVTSFSAALISSLSGDTEEAAEVANQAMIDMSDNANKFGTDISSIQDAYQGFAKQNYTMLDNLKLGYGGTKTEMERLLEDAEELSGVEYDIDNLADVYNAIHVIQEELGVSGTTAEEAEETFTGSLNAMKAAAQNFLGDLALGEDISESMQNMVDAAATFLLNNFLPMLGDIIMQLPDALSGLSGILAEYLESLSVDSGNSLGNYIAQLLINIVKALPSIAMNLVSIANEIVNAIGAALISLIKDFGVWVANGIKGCFSDFGDSLVDLDNVLWSAMEAVEIFGSKIVTAFKTIGKNAIAKLTNVGWATAGKTVIKSVVKGITSLVTSIPNKLKSIGSTTISKFKGLNWTSLGTYIIKGIVKGITNGASTVYSKITSLGKTAVSKLQDVLGISSPSKVFSEEVGQWIPAGVGEGIAANADAVTSALVGTVNTAIDSANATVMTAESTTPALADSIVSGIGTITSGLSNSQNQPITVQTYLYPNSSTYYTETVNAYDTGKRRLATT